jgi:hypothetical protein
MNSDFDNVLRYAAAALQCEITNVTTAEEGSRNKALYDASRRLGQLIGNGVLERRNVQKQLYTAGIERGLPPREVAATILSGIETGVKNPRDLTKIGARRTSVPNLASGKNPPVIRSIEPAPTSAEVLRRARLKRILAGSEPAIGTLAESYLLARGLNAPYPASFRFNRSVRMPDGEDYPCLIALVTHPVTGDFVAIQRTALTSDGKDAVRNERGKKFAASLGPTAGAAVVLGDLHGNDVPSVVEGEGVETVASIVMVLRRPGIATLSVSTLGAPPLPHGLSVLILVDRGAEPMAMRAAKARAAEGRRVWIATPPDATGKDWNDTLRALGPDATVAALRVVAREIAGVLHD